MFDFLRKSLFKKMNFLSYNQFTSSYAVTFLEEINRQVLPTIDIYNSTQMKNLSLGEKQNYINLVFAAAIGVMMSQNFTDEQRSKLNPSFDDFVYLCYFNGDWCDRNNFVWKFDRFFGNCWVFNSGYNQSGHKVDLKQSSFSNGLQITFYVGFDDRLSPFNSYGKGGFAKVENSSFFLDDTMNGIYLKTGNKRLQHFLSRHLKLFFKLF